MRLHTVLSILEHGFFPVTSKEDTSIVRPAHEGKPERFIGIPMVCFTDIPIQLSSEHRAEYGCYGLGLSKEWAKSNKIGPVFYMINGSASWEAYNHMQAVVVDMMQEAKCSQSTKDKVVSSLIELAGYIKPYAEEGREKTFYDEREWRYVPPFQDIPDY
ncbi:MAG: hypothetical protein IJL11_05965 [Synergistaceae bacterium]|nr:hypothetical protein [Synergistaceae bacterium]